MGIRETIKEKVAQVARQYKKDYLREQTKKYEEVIAEYEKSLTEYYKLGIKLEYLNAIERQRPEVARDKEIDELKQQHIVLLKNVKDIENTGVLEEYDAVMEAIENINQNM